MDLTRFTAWRQAPAPPRRGVTDMLQFCLFEKRVDFLGAGFFDIDVSHYGFALRVWAFDAPGLTALTVLAASREVAASGVIAALDIDFDPFF